MVAVLLASDPGHYGDPTVLLSQVLPLVEAFFVLCDARTAHLPPLPEFAPARSMELPPATPAGPAATPAQHPQAAVMTAVNEANLPFLRSVFRFWAMLSILTLSPHASGHLHIVSSAIISCVLAPQKVIANTKLGGERSVSCQLPVGLLQLRKLKVCWRSASKLHKASQVVALLEVSSHGHAL